MSILKDTHVKVYYKCYSTTKLQEEYDITIPLWIALIIVVLGLLPMTNIILFAVFIIYNERYYSYKHWWESIEAYKKLIQRKYNNGKYYYIFLKDIKYAGDKDYINKVKKIAEELE